MTDNTSPTHEVRVVRELNGPPEQVWRAWSDPDLLRRWWGPDGFTCPRAEVDFRVGGATIVTMKAPEEYGGGVFHNRWAYTIIDEPIRIEFVSTFADEDGNVISPVAAGVPPEVPDEVPHVIELEPLPGNRTRLTVMESGYADEGVRRQSQTGQEQCLDKMRELYAQSTSD
jgi:uncharacterized protein YndB with AHSA1/START domain